MPLPPRNLKLGNQPNPLHRITQPAMQNLEFPDFPAYPAYKPSGIEWLGDIPAHWDVLPHRAIFTQIIDRGHPSEQMLSVTIADGIITQKDLLRDASKKDQSRLDKSNYKLVRPGDIAYNKMRAWQGAIGMSDYTGIVSPAYVVHRLKIEANPRYFHYLLRTPAFAAEAARHSYGIASDMWSLRPEHFKVIYSCVPPLPEQRAIAAYLDRKGAIARRYAHVARHIIDTLRELRQVEIHDAVTRGLNEDIPLKPSGVEWLGDVPAHWDTRWLKFWVDTNKRTLSEKTDPNFQFRYIEIGGVSEGALLNEPAAIRFGSAPSRARRIVRQGDTIVSTVRTYLKAVWFADDEADDLVCSTGFAVLTPKVDAFPKFVSYVVQSDAFIHQVMANSDGVAYPAISVSKLRVLYVPVPPMDEQRAIAEYLDAKTAAIDAAIAHYERMAELVAEYWTVLVADAVTGRIDLRQTAAE